MYKGLSNTIFFDPDIDDCSPNPCQNNGVCNDTGANSFKCQCAGGYSGNTCNGKGRFCKRRIQWPYHFLLKWIICTKSNHTINDISMCINQVIPEKPSNFKAGSIGTSSITLIWDAPSQDTDFITSYELYWEVSTGRVWIKLFCTIIFKYKINWFIWMRSLISLHHHSS